MDRSDLSTRTNKYTFVYLNYILKIDHFHILNGKFNENNIYFSHNMLTVNFLCAIKSSSNFYKVRISANYEKIIFQCITLFIPLARQGTFTASCKGDNLNKIGIKCVILESNRECTKGVLLTYTCLSCNINSHSI